MIGLLYGSIWVSLVCLVLAELGRRRHRQTRIVTRWAQVASATGLVLAAAHSVLAVGVVYGWDHAAATQATAARAATVYGVAWPGSLYVNYAFLLAWGLDLGWWWRRPAGFISRAALLEWAWRLLAFTMVVNGAVIFASPAGRLAGVPLCATVIFIWWHDRRF